MASRALSLVSLILVAGLSFTACTPEPKQKKPEPVMSEEMKHTAYKNAMRNVGTDIKQDMNYQKLDLTTPELKSWFTDITYKVWDKQITQQHFISMGLEKFPRHHYEFEVISGRLLASKNKSKS
ncbi:MAG: hypothetical protein U9R26_04425 [Campylobacterota bacterium]|nr:hypothetical protein [Campylobacterota bacterium]